MEFRLKISLKAARVNAELTQREAAKRIGVSREALQTYESGKTIPNWDVVNRIKDVYGIPLDFISFGTKYAKSGQSTDTRTA